MLPQKIRPYLGILWPLSPAVDWILDNPYSSENKHTTTLSQPVPWCTPGIEKGRRQNLESPPVLQLLELVLSSSTDYFITQFAPTVNVLLIKEVEKCSSPSDTGLKLRAPVETYFFYSIFIKPFAAQLLWYKVIHYTTGFWKISKGRADSSLFFCVTLLLCRSFHSHKIHFYLVVDFSLGAW